MSENSKCPTCPHLCRQHDPEDGNCEAGAFPPCGCGVTTGDAVQNAARSRAALRAEEGNDGE